MNICCESSVGKAFSGSSRLDEIIRGLLARREDALLPLGEEGRVRAGVPGSETYSQSIALVFTINPDDEKRDVQR